MLYNCNGQYPVQPLSQGETSWRSTSCQVTEVLHRNQVTPNTTWSQNSSRIDRKQVDKNRNNRILGSAFEIHVKCAIHFYSYRTFSTVPDKFPTISDQCLWKIKRGEAIITLWFRFWFWLGFKLFTTVDCKFNSCKKCCCKNWLLLVVTA